MNSIESTVSKLEGTVLQGFESANTRFEDIMGHVNERFTEQTTRSHQMHSENQIWQREMLAEVRKTNGRVTELEHNHRHMAKALRDLERRFRKWYVRPRATAGVSWSFSDFKWWVICLSTGGTLMFLLLHNILGWGPK